MEKTIYISDLFNYNNLFERSIIKSTNPWFKLFIDLMLPIRYLCFLVLALVVGTYMFSVCGILIIIADYSPNKGFGLLGLLCIIVNLIILSILLYARIYDFINETNKKL